MIKQIKWQLWAIISIIILITGGFFIFYNEKKEVKPIITEEHWKNLTWQQGYYVNGIIWGIGWILYCITPRIIINNNRNKNE